MVASRSTRKSARPRNGAELESQRRSVRDKEVVSAGQFDRLSALGASPGEVAGIVVSGIRSGRFYILTSENRNDAVSRRGTEIVSGGPPAVPFP
jgi:hypothetical protein